MRDAVAALRGPGDGSSSGGGVGVDTALARDEFIAGGQQVRTCCTPLSCRGFSVCMRGRCSSCKS